MTVVIYFRGNPGVKRRSWDVIIRSSHSGQDVEYASDIWWSSQPFHLRDILKQFLMMGVNIACPLKYISTKLVLAYFSMSSFNDRKNSKLTIMNQQLKNYIGNTAWLGIIILQKHVWRCQICHQKPQIKGETTSSPKAEWQANQMVDNRL